MLVREVMKMCQQQSMTKVYSTANDLHTFLSSLGA
jgi:hypothetical protein